MKHYSKSWVRSITKPAEDFVGNKKNIVQLLDHIQQGYRKEEEDMILLLLCFSFFAVARTQPGMWYWFVIYLALCFHFTTLT